MYYVVEHHMIYSLGRNTAVIHLHENYTNMLKGVGKEAVYYYA